MTTSTHLADWLLRGALGVIVLFVLLMTWAAFFGRGARK